MGNSLIGFSTTKHAKDAKWNFLMQNRVRDNTESVTLGQMARRPDVLFPTRPTLSCVSRIS